MEHCIQLAKHMVSSLFRVLSYIGAPTDCGAVTPSINSHVLEVSTDLNERGLNGHVSLILNTLTTKTTNKGNYKLSDYNRLYIIAGDYLWIVRDSFLLFLLHFLRFLTKNFAQNIKDYFSFLP